MEEKLFTSEQLNKASRTPERSVAEVGQEKERQTVAIPNTQPFCFYLDVLGAGEKVDEMPERQKTINRRIETTVKKAKNGKKEEYTVTSSSENFVTSIILEDVALISAKKKTSPKMFTFLFCKALEQSIRNGELIKDNFIFPYSELVEMGFFSNSNTAREGFLNAMDIITSFKLRVASADDTSMEAFAVLFPTVIPQGGGYCKVFLNPQINWGLMTKTLTILPLYFGRLSQRSFALLHLIFKHARLKGESIDKNGCFTIPLETVRASLYLPKVDETTNPQRDIKKPIQEAIEEIEDYEKQLGLLTIKPSVMYGAKIKNFLAGEMTIDLKGVYAEKITEITKKRHKLIEANQERKARIKEKAEVKALAWKKQHEE